MIRLSTTVIDPETVLAEILGGNTGENPMGIATFKRVEYSGPETVKAEFTLTHGARTTVGAIYLTKNVWEHIAEIIKEIP